jgi:hypothetical protein
LQTIRKNSFSLDLDVPVEEQDEGKQQSNKTFTLF